MRTDAQRIAKYEARMQATLLDPVRAAMVTQAVANYTAYAIDFYPKQVALRTILSDEDVPVTLIGAYEAYHGIVYRMSLTLSGDALMLALCPIVALFVSRGCTQAILERIGEDIYSIVWSCS